MSTSTWYNMTTVAPDDALGNMTRSGDSQKLAKFVFTALHIIICFVGLLGNALVIYVILRYIKMKTVTNLYILNLSITDGLFVMGMPFMIVTAILENWIFGNAMCKIYQIVYSINMFTGVFTLLVMSGDRFLAVCYPISSMRFRTIFYARIACGATWFVSFLVMFPVVLYAQIISGRANHYTCTIKWPAGMMGSSQAYICYTAILGFVAPVLLICVLYTLLIIRLKSTGPAVKSAEKRRSHRKITQLVTLIIVVYLICWLPYWLFQFYLIGRPPTMGLTATHIHVYHFLTLMTLANSMLNPFLYAFTNETFRDSFIAAFRCLPIVQSRSGNSRRRESDVDTTAPANNNQHQSAAKRTCNAVVGGGKKHGAHLEETVLTNVTTVNGTNGKTESLANEVNDAGTADPLIQQSSL